MMIGELDVGVIALGIFVAMFAPLVLMIAVMSADAPGSSHAPGYMIIGGGVVAGCPDRMVGRSSVPVSRRESRWPSAASVDMWL
jgi:hypothetical protein